MAKNQFCLVTLHSSGQRGIHQISELMAVDKKGNYTIPATMKILKKTKNGVDHTLRVVRDGVGEAVTVECIGATFEDLLPSLQSKKRTRILKRLSNSPVLRNVNATERRRSTEEKNAKAQREKVKNAEKNVKLRAFEAVDRLEKMVADEDEERFPHFDIYSERNSVSPKSPSPRKTENEDLRETIHGKKTASVSKKIRIIADENVQIKDFNKLKESRPRQDRNNEIPPNIVTPISSTITKNREVEEKKSSEEESAYTRRMQDALGQVDVYRKKCEKLADENKSLKMKITNYETDPEHLPPIENFLSGVREIVRDELQSVNGEKNEDGFEITEEHMLNILPDVRLSSTTLSRISCAKTIKQRTNCIVNAYWTKEERSLMYMKKMSAVENSKVVEEIDIDNFTVILSEFQKSRPRNKPRDQHWQRNLRTWISAKLKWERNEHKRLHNKEPKEKNTNENNNNLSDEKEATL